MVSLNVGRESVSGNERANRSLSGLRSRLDRSIRELAKSEFTLVQVEILEELMSGRRTVEELVEAIYSVRRGETGHSTQYSRIRREVRQLESRGFVSRKRLLGRNKPYGLTTLAVAKLANIEDVQSWGPLRVVPAIDWGVYAGVLAMGIFGLAIHGTAVAHSTFTAVVLSFAFGSGIAFTRFVQTLRRVM
jgi:hypothetical protein